MDTSPAKPCNHCGTIDPRKPRSLDRDDNWLCDRCHMLEQEAQEDEAVY